MATARPAEHRLRLGRWTQPEFVYLVTWATKSRHPFFLDFWAARLLIRSLRFSDARHWTRTLAYVVMPDHVHWLFELGRPKYLSRLIGDVKSYTAHELVRRFRIGSHVWQSGFHDHAVRREENLVEISRYIVANPLRANLCQQIGDYPHWDAVWLHSD